MKPNKNTVFLNLGELYKYSDKDKYYCTAIVFYPDTENDHFNGCPPYIEISPVDTIDDNDNIFFEVPEIVAYYGTVHAGYTMRGRDKTHADGERSMKNKIKNLLDL